VMETLLKPKTFEYLLFGRQKKATALVYLDEDKLLTMARKAIERNRRGQAVAGPLRVKVFTDE